MNQQRSYEVCRADGSQIHASFSIPSQEGHLDTRNEEEKVNSGEYDHHSPDLCYFTTIITPNGLVSRAGADSKMGNA